MGVLADFIGGLIAGEKGDAQGFVQGVTKQGRANLAVQRQNQLSQQQLLAQALEEAKNDPQKNAYLQQMLSQGVTNQSTIANTEGQQLQNENATAENKALLQYGGKAGSARELGQQQLAQGQQSLDQQSRRDNVSHQDAFMSRMLQELGLAQNERQFQAQEGRLDKQFTTETNTRRLQTAGGIVEKLPPDYSKPGAPPADAMVQVLKELGVTVPPSAEELQRQKLRADILQGVQGVRGGKPKSGVGVTEGLVQPSQAVPQDFTPSPNAPKQPGAEIPSLRDTMGSEAQKQLNMPQSLDLQQILKLIQYLQAQPQ